MAHPQGDGIASAFTTPRALFLAILLAAPSAWGAETPTDVLDQAGDHLNAISISFPGTIGFWELMATLPPGPGDFPSVGGVLTFTYERVVASHLVLSFSFTPLWADPPDVVGGVVLWLSLDWHPFDSSIRGFFLGIAIAYDLVLTSNSSLVPTGFVSDGIGAEIGWEIPIGRHWDGFIVAGQTAGLSIDAGVALRMGLGVGYQF